MTSFITPTLSLLNEIEPEAGDVVPPSRRDPVTMFFPDWDYLASPAASTKAVVAGLTLSFIEVPERLWGRIIQTHCPQTHQALTEHGLSIETLLAGHAPAPVFEIIAGAINTELGGYQVLAGPDAAAMTPTVIAELGAVPTVADPCDAKTAPAPPTLSIPAGHQSRERTLVSECEVCGAEFPGVRRYCSSICAASENIRYDPWRCACCLRALEDRPDPTKYAEGDPRVIREHLCQPCTWILTQRRVMASPWPRPPTRSTCSLPPVRPRSLWSTLRGWTWSM
ncbi:hypothetical protein GCM10012275_42780 [Longimycelium tulufanense]|uniref:Uncharacterized protein n=1 Tax=Longimycelium tulufanense TaxID=907463 RepID=A0A8J3CHK0_9PSEU|nr:hypothetical protein [Longimycelium tulufanense]GGM67643.1 hypothetical protein GCM10012275_42780 [Longimycelium tulufanense]